MYQLFFKIGRIEFYSVEVTNLPRSNVMHRNVMQHVRVKYELLFLVFYLLDTIVKFTGAVCLVA